MYIKYLIQLNYLFFEKNKNLKKDFILKIFILYQYH